MTRGRVSVHCSGMMENQYDLQYETLLINTSNTNRSHKQNHHNCRGEKRLFRGYPQSPMLPTIHCSYMKTAEAGDATQWDAWKYKQKPHETRSHLSIRWQNGNNEWSSAAGRRGGQFYNVYLLYSRMSGFQMCRLGSLTEFMPGYSDTSHLRYQSVHFCGKHRRFI